MSPFKVYIELTKNDPIDSIFGLWLVIMFQNPIERILKILIFCLFYGPRIAENSMYGAKFAKYG